MRTAAAQETDEQSKPQRSSRKSSPAAPKVEARTTSTAGAKVLKIGGKSEEAKPKARRAPTRGKSRKATAARTARGKGRKGLANGGRRKLLKVPPKPAPRHVKVRELDPLVMCGPGTSVARLFRVDERVNGLAATHLVFYDRHGWYCEHGRSCPAVHDVRKLGKHTGTDYNGRMRA